MNESAPIEKPPLEITQDMRDRAFSLRHSFIESLETHLLALESNLIDHKVNVRWAQDETALCDSIVELLPGKQYNSACFDVANVPELLSTYENVINPVSVEAVVNHDQETETLIVESDFAIAENGSLVFVNRKSSDCFNLVRNVIVIVNIDQIIVSQSDLSLFLRLKSGNASSDFPSDVKILNKPYKKIVSDLFLSSQSVGYTEEDVTVSVILYDNNITDILQDANLRQSLYCIHCGRCATVCPVMKVNNGLSPIDLVKKNCFDQFNKTQSIFQQTSLCGNCQEVCPINIPLVDLLIYEMNLVSENTSYNKTKSFFSILSKRSKINKKNSPFWRYFFLKRFYSKNKMLLNYLLNQKEQFYNITRESGQDTAQKVEENV